MKKTLTAVFALGNVKKQILAALLPALVCGTQALGALEFNRDQDWDSLTISGEGTFEEFVNWFNTEGNRAQFIITNGATIKFGTGESPATNLPYSSMIEMLAGTKFSFEELITVRHNPDTDGPVFYTGEFVPEEQNGSLNLNISSTALDAWFDKYKDHSNIMEFTLIDQCMFDNSRGPVTCTFADLTEGYTYESSTGETFKNVGIITDVSKLKPNEIALLYRPTGKTEMGWVYGTFSLVAVGSKYEPVPEPATGTLSLVALAGLVARRRRK